ncbi:hypothetical protein HGM15179_012852, partial [Zosterops borbonicus]
MDGPKCQMDPAHMEAYGHIQCPNKTKDDQAGPHGLGTTGQGSEEKIVFSSVLPAVVIPN